VRCRSKAASIIVHDESGNGTASRTERTQGEEDLHAGLVRPRVDETQAAAYRLRAISRRSVLEDAVLYV